MHTLSPVLAATLWCEALESDRPEFKFQLHHLQLGASYSYLGLYVLIYERRGAAGGTVGCIAKGTVNKMKRQPIWVVPVHQPQASSIVHRTWTGNSFHTWSTHRQENADGWEEVK